MKKLSIIIVAYNNQETIQKCLESVFGCIYYNIYYNIYIIDNASQDNTASIVKNTLDSELRVTSYELRENPTNVGFSAAVNQGIKLAQKESGPDFFLLLNPDAYLKKDCLKELLNCSQKGVGLTSPLMLDSSNNQPWFVGGKINWPRMKAEHVDWKREIVNWNRKTKESISGFQISDSDYLSGCCLLIPKQVIRKVGFFDEKFFLYYEDVDYSLRAKKVGFGLKIIPKAICYHDESVSFKSPLLPPPSLPLPEGEIKRGREKKSYYLVKSGLLFFYKHYPAWAKPYFWIVFYLRYAYHKYISKKSSVLKAMNDFVKDK